jgi:hypothetical protein
MSVRLDPRRRDQLKRLASEAEMRPGELVRQWIVERLEAESAGGRRATGPDSSAAAIKALGERVAALERRIEQLAASATPPAAGRGEVADGSGGAVPRRVALHEEIAAVIAETGPLPASEIAARVGKRKRYRAPRSARPIDAATINSRVSNPHYRDRFVRRGGRIGLAED